MGDLCDFLAGWVAGVVGLVVGHPMDTIKTNQQMTATKISNTQIYLNIVKKEGVRGLYNGMLFPLLCSGTLNSVFFGIHGYCLRHLQESRGNDKNLYVPSGPEWYWDTFVAGTVAGIGQVLLGCPSEVIKVRLHKALFVALTAGVYRPSDAFVSNRRPCAYYTGLDIYKKYGIRGFYRGLTPMLWRDATTTGIYIMSYQYIRYNFYGRLDSNPGLLPTLMAGGIAGLLCWVPVIPFDTIKSRMQADDLKTPFYKSVTHCGLHILKEGGYRSFFKGFHMIALRSFPTNAIIFYSYELFTDHANCIPPSK